MSLSRRDLIKLGGAAFIASLMPDHLVKLMGARDLPSALSRLTEWDLPVHAQAFGTPITPSGKTIWNGLLYTNLTDLYASHGMPWLPQMTRTTFGGGFATTHWPDDTTGPLPTFYDAYAAQMLATSDYTRCPQGWFQFDLESLPGGAPGSTQAERLAAATVFKEVAVGLKAAAPPLKMGFYGAPQLRNYNLTVWLPGHANYEGWQGINDDWAECYPYIDAFFPSLYWSYTRANDDPQTVSQVRHFYIENIHEQYRLIKKYGRPGEQKVFPFIEPYRTSSAEFLDHDVFEMAVRTCLQLADGFVIWTGFGLDWNDAVLEPWWTEVLEPILLSRRLPAKSIY